MNKKSILEYENFKVGDRVMKKSGNPFIMYFPAGQLSRESVYFTGRIRNISIMRGKYPEFTIVNNRYEIKRIPFDVVKHIDREQIKTIYSVWRSLHFGITVCEDYRFCCYTDYTRTAKLKEKYDTTQSAFLAAYSLQSKNLHKEYVVYNCSHCNNFHVGTTPSQENLELIEQNILPLMGLS